MSPAAKKSAPAKPASKKSAAAKKPAAETPVSTKTAAIAKKPAAKKPAAQKPTAKKPAAKRSTAASGVATKQHGPRADFGAPIDGFFAKQPPQLREILVALREMIESTVPDAEASIKWGMPFFTLDGVMMCAIGGHKSHVNLVLSGPPGTYEDPDGRLTGEAKTGRHLKLTSLAELPRAAVQQWLRAAAAMARSKH